MTCIGNMLRSAGCDFGLAETIKVRDRVRHYGTKEWGVVLEVVPQRDGTAELRVLVGQRETWWATYHCDRVESDA